VIAKKTTDKSADHLARLDKIHPQLGRHALFRVCLVFAGMIVAANTAYAEGDVFSHGIKVAFAGAEDLSHAGSAFGNTPRFSHSAEPKNEVLDDAPPLQHSYVSPNPYVSPNRQAGKNALSSSAGGEILVSNKNPKAAAKSLKEAILAMNASGGDFSKKSAK